MFKFERVTRYVLLGFVLLSLLMMVFVVNTDTGFVNPIYVILTMFVLYLVFRAIDRGLQKLSVSQLRGIIALSVIGVAVSALLNVILIRVQLFGDVQICITMARQLVQGNFNWSEWILQYKNLVPLTILYSVFMRVGQFLHIGFNPIFLAYNIALLLGSVILIISTLWHKNPRAATFAALLSTIIPAFYSFIIQVGYTDGASIFALALLLFFFECRRLNWWKLLIIALVFAYGYLMRPNLIIALVALVIIGLFTYKTHRNIYRKVIQLFIASIVGLLLAIGAGKVLDANYHYNSANLDEFPIAHWIYMGLNQQKFGEYNRADRSYTLHHIGFSSAQSADISGIATRLASYNPETFIFHLFVKYGILWREGTFQTLTDYQKSYIFAPKFYLEHISAIRLIFQVFSKALVALFLLAVALRLLSNKKLTKNSFLFALLTIFGISLFHTLIWEVKTRYQFMTFGLLFFIGVYSLIEHFEKVPVVNSHIE
ncbi:permease [Lactococcus protaetiae]|nr:permease [Lactococcus protaetiae]